MTFQDIFSSEFLSKVSSFSVLDCVLALGMAFLIGLFIYAVYRKTFAGVMYSRTFNISLIGLCMLTAFVILAVTSNVVLSLGMVGALSIVRFRTAIKDPMDIVFLFWSIAAGIVLGAGLIPLAIFGSLLVGLVLVIFSRLAGGANPYILMVTCADEQSEKQVFGVLAAAGAKIRLKSKTVRENDAELAIEVRIKGDDTAFVARIAAIKTVSNAVLVAYNGEYAA